MTKHELTTDESPTGPIDVQDATEELGAVEASARLREESQAAGEQIPEVEQRAVTRARRSSWRIGTFLMVVGFVGMISLGVAALLIAQDAAERVADERVARLVSEQQADDEQARTSAAVTALQQANAELAARGQSPVAPPSPGAPDSDTLVAATTARVLAACQVCSAAEIGRLVAVAVAAQPVGPSPAELATAIANYLQANPPAPGRNGDNGRDGDKGEPGRPPTAEEIQDAVTAYLAANPPPAGPQGAPPASWTWPDPVVPGVLHTCTRTGGPDDAATYECD